MALAETTRTGLLRLALAWFVAFAAAVTSKADDSHQTEAAILEPPTAEAITASPEGEAPGSDDPVGGELIGPGAAELAPWQPLTDGGDSIYEHAADDSSHGAEEAVPLPDEESDLRPFDYMRQWGFRHSSTDGRFLPKNVPMAYSSWLNRPYHLDWFAGPLLSDDPAEGRVSQSNEILAGLRLGWDFDYYWGLQWRLAWADPEILHTGADDSTGGTYVVGDLSLLYYPWGDTKVRPFFQLGLGGTQIASLRDNGAGHEAWLLSMPFGIGVEFPQTRWLAWKLEIIDNLAFASDDIDTMHNVAFTAGMEYRFGARPGSYWPWRSSRTSW